MARELKILLWCDGPHGEDQIEATQSVVATLGSKKARSIDVCDACYLEKVSPLLEMLDKHGVEPDAPVTLPKQPRPARNSPNANIPCPRCDVKSTWWNGLTQHVRLRHDITTPELREMMPEYAPPIRSNHPNGDMLPDE